MCIATVAHNTASMMPNCCASSGAARGEERVSKRESLPCNMQPRTHEELPVQQLRHVVPGLAGGQVQDLAGDLDVAALLRRLQAHVHEGALDAAQGLVHHDARVLHRVPLPLGAVGEDERLGGLGASEPEYAQLKQASLPRTAVLATLPSATV